MVKKKHVVPGTKITGKLSNFLYGCFGGYYVFENPIQEYMGDIDALEDNIGKYIDMGYFPTLIVEDAQNICVVTKESMFYTILHPGFNQKGTRFSTDPSFYPTRLTLDELKLLIIKEAGLTPQDAMGIEAKVIFKENEYINGRFQPLIGLEFSRYIIQVPYMPDPYNLFNMVRTTSDSPSLDRANFMERTLH